MVLQNIFIKDLVTCLLQYITVRWGSRHSSLFERISVPYCILVPLKSCLIVASLYIFYRCFQVLCSSKLTNCMPSCFNWSRLNDFPRFTYPYTIQTAKGRFNRYLFLHSIYVLLSLLLVSSRRSFLCLYYLLPMTSNSSGVEYKDTFCKKLL